MLLKILISIALITTTIADFCNQLPEARCCSNARISRICPERCGAVDCNNLATTGSPTKAPKEPKPSDETLQREERQTAAIVKNAGPSEFPGGVQNAPANCGKGPNYAPCVKKDDANRIFKSCCEANVPTECHSLCNYETDKQKALTQLKQAFTKENCLLKYVSPILYCASQNRDNTACCRELGLADKELKVGDKCLRMCDIRGNNGIQTLEESDLVCLGNWNVMMYCHQSGL